MYTGYFLGFSVYVSNSTERLQGTQCFKDVNFTLDTIPAVVTIVCPVHGQYVIYYNERLREKIYPDNYNPTAENNLCEIEVYGEYSQTCSLFVHVFYSFLNYVSLILIFG